MGFYCQRPEDKILFVKNIIIADKIHQDVKKGIGSATNDITKSLEV
jgi:hypothetical protein